HSGNEYEGLLGRPDPVPLATMGEILRQTPGPWVDSDLEGVIPEPYIVVAPIHVEGIAPGFYRYRAGHHELIPVYRGPEAEALLTRKIVHTNGIRVDSLAFCAFVVTPTDQALAAAGARAYRLLHLRAGAAAQRAGLAAAAHDLFCRPNLTYLPVLAEQLLGLSGSDHTVIHQLLFGRNHYRGWRFDLSL
ncbi:MAG: hypothetical protein JWN15_684, partial [Firmicutes bacterium]|nr:hypothetical protein [Bacillota bacterium]